MIRDRLNWTRFLGFTLGDRTPDQNIIRHFRNRMAETGTLKRVMRTFDWQLHRKGYIPMSGQTVDASLVPAPNQRNTDGESDAIKTGQSADEIWPDKPAKEAQKDSAYRSQSNEAWLADRMLSSRIHRRKPKDKSMPIATAWANAAKSSIRARIEHVFAHQKSWFGSSAPSHNPGRDQTAAGQSGL